MGERVKGGREGGMRQGANGAEWNESYGMEKHGMIFRGGGGDNLWSNGKDCDIHNHLLKRNVQYYSIIALEQKRMSRNELGMQQFVRVKQFFTFWECTWNVTEYTAVGEPTKRDEIELKRKASAGSHAPLRSSPSP